MFIMRADSSASSPGGGLIHNQDARLGGENGRDGHALAFAFRQRKRVSLFGPGQTDRLQRFGDPGIAFIGRTTRVLRAKGDFLAHGFRENLMVWILKDVSDEGRQNPGLLRILSEHQDATFRRQQEPVA